MKPRSAFARFVILLIFFGGFTYLHFISRFSNIRKKQSHITPGWISRQNEETCNPVTNIGFLKTHKCASSAIQNILFRYGFKHSLVFALPENGNYFGGRIAFNDFMVKNSMAYKMGINIFAVHTKWDQEKVMSIMPENSVYISIVREPIVLFESLYTYSKMEKILNKTLDQYVATEDINRPRHMGYLGYNQMTWDFGVPLSEMNNLTYIQEMVEKADKSFDLVMVAERIEESLILMSHLLCWDITDVTVLKINARMAKFKQKMKAETQNLLRKKLAPDYLIYNFFSQKFSKLVEDYGKERMERDVSRLKEATEKFMKGCGFDLKESRSMVGPNKPWSDQVSGYISQSKDITCQHMSRSEHSFLDVLRRKQMNQYLMSFRRQKGQIPPEMNALPTGAVPLQGAGNISERMKRLQESLVHKVQEGSVEGNITHRGETLSN